MKHYWVIGGEYKSTDFDEMIEGTEKVVGPLSTRDQAISVWRELSNAAKSCALTRFSVASN